MEGPLQDILVLGGGGRGGGVSHVWRCAVLSGCDVALGLSAAEPSRTHLLAAMTAVAMAAKGAFESSTSGESAAETAVQKWSKGVRIVMEVVKLLSA